MISIRLIRLALVAWVAAALCGCIPAGSSQSVEEKEPHFQRGRERVNSMDYRGAIESFEKALEVNPHSGAAHFELGWLYANKQPEPATAIYHYEQYLRLRPRAENSDTIRQHILGLKQDLAKVVLPLPSTPGVQRQMEQLMEENRRLTEEVEKWRAHYAGQDVTAPTGAMAVVPRSTALSGGVVSNPAPAPRLTQNPRAVSGGSSPAVQPAKLHRVQSGETPSSIAKKYNVKLDALLAANPGLEPRRMKVGQELKLPVP